MLQDNVKVITYEEFTKLYDLINHLSKDVLWEVTIEQLLIHKVKYANPVPCLSENVRGFLNRFLGYAEENYTKYLSGCYFELFADWIKSSPVEFGSTQQRFVRAMTVWVCLFMGRRIANRDESNALLLLAFQYISIPERFAAVLWVLLRSKADHGVVFSSKLYHEFFLHHASTLSEEDSPIKLVYYALNTFNCSNIKSFTTKLTSIPFSLNDYSENTLLESYSLSGLPCLERDLMSISFDNQVINHFSLSENLVLDYYVCFGLDWMYLALNSILGYPLIYLFISKLMSLSMESAYSLLSRLVDGILNIELEASQVMLGRLAFLIKNNKLLQGQLFRHPSLFLILIHHPEFSPSSYSPVDLTRALQYLLAHTTPHSTTQFYYVLKFFRAVEATLNKKDDSWVTIYRLVIDQIFTETGSPIDFKVLNSAILFSGIKQFSVVQENAFQSVLMNKIHFFTTYSRLEAFFDTHPEKLSVLILFWKGQRADLNVLDRTILKSLWLLSTNVVKLFCYDDSTADLMEPCLEYEREGLDQILRELSSSESEQLEILITAMPFATQKRGVNKLISYLFQNSNLLNRAKSSRHVILNIIGENQLDLLKELTRSGLQKEIIEGILLTLIQKNEDIWPCLVIFFEHAPQLSDEVYVELLLFIYLHSRLDILHAWSALSGAHELKKTLFGKAFEQIMSRRFYFLLEIFSGVEFLISLDMILYYFKKIAHEADVKVIEMYLAVFGDLVPLSFLGELYLASAQVEHMNHCSCLYKQMKKNNLIESRMTFFCLALNEAYPNLRTLEQMAHYENPEHVTVKKVFFDILVKSINDDEMDIFVLFHRLLKNFYTRDDIDKLYSISKRCDCKSIIQLLQDDCCEHEDSDDELDASTPRPF